MLGQDITFCKCDCQNADCFRHTSHVDWELPKHKYYGASMSDFSRKCDKYLSGGEQHVE